MAAKHNSRFLVGVVVFLTIMVNVALIQRSFVVTVEEDVVIDHVEVAQIIPSGPTEQRPTGVKYVQQHDQPRDPEATVEHWLKKNKLRCPSDKRPSPKDVRVLRTVWQVHDYEKSSIYIYSAFYDDRPAVGFQPVLRIITMATHDVNPIYCHIWYEELTEPYVVSAIVNETGINRYSFDRPYREYTYTCELPIAQPVPTHVSLSKAKVCGQKLTTYEPIHYVPRQDPPIEFGVCVTNGYGYHPIHEIVEWIEVQRLYGVEEFNLYDSMYINMSKVFNHYIEKGLLNVHSVPHPLGTDDDKWYHKMRNLRTTALNDCMMRNMYRYRYMVILDLDEMIVPRHHTNYSTVLDQIDARLNLTERFHSYTFRNVYFFREFEQFKNETLRSLRYRYRARHNGEFFGSKSFVSPLCCFNLFNHYCWKLLPTYKKTTVFSPAVVAASHHYRKCGFSTCQKMYEQKTLDNVMMKIRSRLKEKVNPVLKELGQSAYMVK